MTIHNFLKSCSILPALIIMPAMATDYTTVDERVVVSANDTANFLNVNVADMVSTSDGAVIYNEIGGVVGISAGTFSGNNAQAGGNGEWGGVAFNKGTMTINGATFKNNVATSVGGVIANSKDGGDLTITGNTIFENNHAAADGGAIGNYYAMSINGAVFRGNTAQLTQDSDGNWTIPVVGDSTPVGGGAISLGAVSATKVASIANTTFENNKSGTDGGAIATRKGAHGDNSAATLDIAATFTNNSAVDNGGAIYNTFYTNNGLGKGNGVTITGTFSGNTAGVYGGAIYNDGASDNAGGNGGVMTINNATFKSNTAADGAGAIYNSGTLTINGGVFGGSTTQTVDGKTQIVSQGNQGYYGGAIYSSSGGILTVQDEAVFTRNTAHVGGAITDGPSSTSMKIDDVTFRRNHAEADGGALGVYKYATVNDATFFGNTAAITVDNFVTASTEDPDGGGAIFLGGEGQLTITDSTFSNNESGVRGGAISARHIASNNGLLDISDSEFRSNKAATHGGAIASIYNGVIKLSDVEFTNNKAGQNGGAIYLGVDINYGATGGVESTNNGVLNITSPKDEVNVFSGNVADGLGGAIYASAGSVVNLGGVNIFTNNSHDKQPISGDTEKYKHSANDIYNLGKLNITDGTTTIASGIAGTGILTVDEGATLNVGTSVIAQDTLNLNGTINIDVMKNGRVNSVNRNNTVAVSQDNINGKLLMNTINFGENGKLNMNIGSAGTYEMFGNAMISEADQSKVQFGNTYDVSYQYKSDTADGEKVGLLIVTTKAVADIAADTGISQSSAEIVSLLANSDNAGLTALSLITQQELNNGNAEYVNSELAKANPENKPIVQSVAADAQNQVLNMASARMASGAAVGRNGGDYSNTEYGMWAHGLFNKSKMGDLFHGYTRGFAVGVDALIDKKYTLGIGGAFNNTDVHAANARDTDIDSNTVFIYGQYKPNKWYANATATYTKSEYTENAYIYGDKYLAQSQYDVNAYGAAIMTGYDFASGFTPEMGARYLHISQDAYNNGITNVEKSNTDYMTGIAGIKYAFALDTDSTWNWRPELHAAATYDFISDKAYATVANPGAAAYVVDADRLSRMGGEFGLGMNMTYRGLDILVKYDLSLREDYTSQTGMVKFRLDF